MSKNKDKKDKKEKGNMKRKEFEQELAKLQGELVKMQQWVVASGAKICVLFEGRDSAGKGGVIKRSRANRTGKITDVFPTLYALSARSGRGDSL
jgi:polyphosphate kinase 2 (PPK2 family)